MSRVVSRPGRWLTGLLLVLLAGCPKSAPIPVIPTLPGDGDEHTAKPKPIDKTAEDDPWAHRNDLIEAPEAQAPSPLALPPFERFTLDNGLEVIVVPNDALPLVEMQLVVEAGDRDSARDRMGIASFAAALLTTGTKKRTAERISDQIDQVGGALQGTASYEATLIRCSVLAKDLGTCMTLLPDVVVHPVFREDEMARVRDQIKLALLQRRDDAAQLAAAHFDNLLWGDDHPRGWPTSLATVSSITRKDLQQWHRTWFRPNNSILAVAGAVDAKKLRRDLNRAFAGWRKGKVPEHKVPEPRKLDGITVRLVDRPGQTQAQIQVGHFGLRHKDPDFYAATVFNYALGGSGFSSRLREALRSAAGLRRSGDPGAGGAKRSEEGKGFGASSSFDRSADVGEFSARAVSRTAETVATLLLLTKEISKMAKSGPTDQEVAGAITNIAGRYSTGFESTSAIANAVLGARLHGLPGDYVRNFAVAIGHVTPEAARRAAAERLHPDQLAVVIVGDAAGIGPQLRAAGFDYQKVGYLDPIASWERAPEPKAADSAVAATAGREILDKALAAKGGRAKLEAIHSMAMEATAKGTVQDPKGGRQSFDATIKRFYLEPDRIRRDMDIENGQIVSAIVLNGNSAWAYESQGGKAGAGELPPAFVTALSDQLWRDQDLVLLRHLDPDTKVAALADQKVDGVDHYVVRIARADGSGATVLYIDKKSLMLDRITYSAQGSAAVEDYSDYRDVSGIKVAYRRLTTDAATSFDLTVTGVDFNPEKVNAQVFQKPEPKSQPKPKSKAE